MTAPSKKLRELVKRRDGERCVACGTSASLEFQHRQATGMGGRGSKAPKLTASDAILLCTVDNADAEAAGQATALAFGWKVRRWSPVPVEQVPVYYRLEGVWYLINWDGSRDVIAAVDAKEIIARSAGVPDKAPSR